MHNDILCDDEGCQICSVLRADYDAFTSFMPVTITANYTWDETYSFIDSL